MPPIDVSLLPKLGQTRCYWALLSADLEYLYVDPVLQAHLGPQANAILGRKLLEFVHPDEHASAQQDLGKVLESRTLHGSVTRVRYSRLYRARARLGFTGAHEIFADEDKVSFDEDYIACDLVINWAAEGVVLCFIHAVVDMSPQDNDEHNRTHWTNWCGTPRMTVEHGSDLYHALFHVAPHAAHGAPPPTRVFQILHNSTDRPILFSWPPEGYISGDYGRLANDVQIGGTNGSDAKTSCTRRYKAQQVLNTADGNVREVESIFIPHGHIIFACHKATPRRSRGHPNSYPLYPTTAQFYDPPTAQSHAPYYSSMPVEPYPGPAAAGTYPYHAPHQAHSQPLQVHPHSSSLSSAGPSSPGGSRTTGTHSPYPQWPPPSVPPPQHSPYVDHSQQGGQRYSPSPFVDEVPPPRQRAGRLTPDVGTGASASMPAGVSAASRETYQGGGRAGGNPPVGVSRCAACKSTSSPEWRKGPSGRKDLCNACGLRYSRARAKKEGTSVQRKRKEGVKASTPTGAGMQSQGSSPSIPTKRRGYASNEHAEFGLEDQQQPPQQHQQQHHHHLGPVPGPGSGDGSTPSPSPPHDYPQHSHHPYSHPYSYSAQNSLYVGPTHAYATPPHHHQHHQHHHPHSNGFYAPTPSPAPGELPGATTAGASPAGSGGGVSVGVTSLAASYERAGIVHQAGPRSSSSSSALV